MAKAKSLGVVWSINPDLKIEVRYHVESVTPLKESIAFVWKTRGRQPNMKALTALERKRLLDLLLKLSRSAFKERKR